MKCKRCERWKDKCQIGFNPKDDDCVNFKPIPARPQYKSVYKDIKIDELSDEIKERLGIK